MLCLTKSYKTTKLKEVMFKIHKEELLINENKLKIKKVFKYFQNILKKK